MELSDLAALGIRRELADGEVLCRQGERGLDAYVVLEGQIDSAVAAGDKTVSVGSQLAGSLVGEVTAVVGGTRIATLTASGSTAISVIDQPSLSGWLDANPTAAAAVLAMARERTDRTRIASLLATQLGPGGETLAGAIAQKMVWRSVPAGETLYRKGDPSTAAYFIVSGRVRLVGESDRQAGNGELLGAVEAIEEQPRMSTATALRHVTLGELSLDDFLTLSSAHPRAAMRLVRRLSSPSNNRSRSTRSRTVALVVIDDVPLEELAVPILAATSALCPSGLLTPRLVDQALGSPGISEVPVGADAEVRLAELLHQVEVGNDVVLLAATAQPSEWLDRILRYADLVLMISTAHPMHEQARTIDRLTAQLDRLDRAVPVWLGLRHPPRSPRARKTADTKARFAVDEVHHLRPDVHGDLGRVGRLAVGRGTAVVLSGGGARGFAHIGAFQSLDECGIAVDRVAGASMGSVIAAAVAQGLAGPELVDVVERQFEGLLDYTVPMVSVLKGAKISENIRLQWGAFDIEDLWIPFSCVSTNLTRSRSEIHRGGPVHHAVRASVALPGILPPVPLGGDLLIDGGVLDNLPISLVENDPSVGTIIAIDVSPTRGPSAQSDFGPSVSGWAAVADLVRGRRELPTLASVLMRSVSVGSARVRDQYLARGSADLYLDLDLGGVGLLDFSEVRPIAERGYAAAHPQLVDWAAKSGSST